MTHPCVGAERREVQQLAGAAGTQGEEPGEGIEIADVREGPDVALDVRPQVRVEPRSRVDVRLVQTGEGALPQDLVAIERRWHDPLGVRGVDRPRSESGTPGELGDRERKQLEQPRPSGETLRDPVRQKELLAPGQHHRPGPALVEKALQIGEQIGRALDFVENDPVRALESAKETTRILGGFGPRLEVLQGDVPKAGERGASQGRLARLARPGQEDGRELRGQRHEAVDQRSANHLEFLASGSCLVKSKIETSICPRPAHAPALVTQLSRPRYFGGLTQRNPTSG